MDITFLGAAETVTGSKYLITHQGRRVLVDCGLFQGLKELRLRNWQPLPVEPSSVDAVVLTHAHVDHSGYLPLLAKRGFSGKIYCSPATRELCELLLVDAAHLQEEDAAYANRKGFSKHRPALPLYDNEDARRVLEQFVDLPFGQSQNLWPDLSVELLPAGHILGAAMPLLRGPDARLLFSGDLGRPNDPILVSPTVPPVVDALVVESTYGHRTHGSNDPKGELGAVIARTIARRGVVVVPAFAVGRTQLLLHYIHELKRDGVIPKELPVYLDSPMAEDASEIYLRHRSELRWDERDCRESFRQVAFVRTTEQSKWVDRQTSPMIIVSASGMLTGGRVLHHVEAFGGDARNCILLVGYQAEGTRGATLLSGGRALRMHGREIPIEAEVASIGAMSAHADADEILGWLRKFPAAPQRVFVTHGEVASANALATRIQQELGWSTSVPRYLTNSGPLGKRTAGADSA